MEQGKRWITGKGRLHDQLWWSWWFCRVQSAKQESTSNEDPMRWDGTWQSKMVMQQESANMSVNKSPWRDPTNTWRGYHRNQSVKALLEIQNPKSTRMPGFTYLCISLMLLVTAATDGSAEPSTLGLGCRGSKLKRAVIVIEALKSLGTHQLGVFAPWVASRNRGWVPAGWLKEQCNMSVIPLYHGK